MTIGGEGHDSYLEQKGPPAMASSGTEVPLIP